MLETDKVFAGSIPENYDRYIVPLIFEKYAQDLAQRVAVTCRHDRPFWKPPLAVALSPAR